MFPQDGEGEGKHFSNTEYLLTSDVRWLAIGLASWYAACEILLLIFANGKYSVEVTQP